MITHCSAATFYSVSISEPIPIRLGKNLTKFYKIFQTELDSVRKRKTIFKPRKKCRTESDSVRKRISNILEIKNSESNPNRYRKICKTKLLIYPAYMTQRYFRDKNSENQLGKICNILEKNNHLLIYLQYLIYLRR